MLITSNARAWLHGAIVALVLGTAVVLVAQQPVTVSNVPHVIVDTAPATAVTGTFFQATQPVSIATMPTTAVTGTFFQATQPVSGTVTAVQATGTNLHIVCDSGCSSSTAPADRSTFTFGTTSLSPVGGAFDDTPPADLTTGMIGAFRLTPKRGLHINLRTQAGAEFGTAAVPVQVSLANTAANGTALSVSVSNPSPNSTESATCATGGTTIPYVIPFTQIYGAGGSSTWSRLTAGQAAMNASLPVTIASNQSSLPVTAAATTATTTDTALTNYLTSAASTNATSVKASAGNVYLLRLVNTTATLYYLRMYNLASAPTCSSATGFIETIPIPASATGAGIVSPQSFGQSYTTGIAYCLTGGGASTDNTNAATGVYVTVLYK